jgi:hypothetical protein
MKRAPGLPRPERPSRACQARAVQRLVRIGMPVLLLDHADRLLSAPR